MSNAIDIFGRGSPVQTAHPGPSSCTQKICSAQGCVDNSVTFLCMSIVKPAYDISFLGRTMRCDAIGANPSYPYLMCDCEWDPVNCLDSGVKSQFGPPSTSVAGLTGYVADTTVIGGTTAAGGATKTSTTAVPTSTSGGSGSSGSSGSGGSSGGSGSTHGGAAASVYHERISIVKMLSLALCVGVFLIL
ncbi:uncharacterized protein B0I36DRAFT_364470 [Microdochium trichocladiopsis]|uniref:Uncharacterized protein n=1 Tax=Microdochium trichocladiopsis TaxID=1682393 RepID=A0A9P9BNC0_9PEZI|nr:uncharacterized protein B0I36DRAFT_364470 [Microdochium trichocladiopsis]KAH7027234.1 hypothetical protein B0I36DRAFT_364470 [Microdochium trichocladiopsis]